MSRRAVESMLWALVVASVLNAGTSAAQAPAPQPQTPPPSSPASPNGMQAAPAAPQASEPTPEAVEAARLAYARGQEAFAAGRYDAARRAFEDAFAAVPNPIVLLSVAESRAKLGQVSEAIDALTRYLQLRPDAPDRAQVEAKLTALRNTPATVAVTSVPPGATLSLDESPETRKAPALLEVPPGKHTLTYSLPGYETRSELLVVEPGARYELEIVLQAAAPEAPPPEPTPAPEPAAETREEVAPATLWITGSIGAAGIVTGTVLGFLALKEQSDFESNPTEASADRGERLALFADVGFGVGAMALITTAVLLFTHDSAVSTPADTDLEGARLELVPSLTPNTASATARVRF